MASTEANRVEWAITIEAMTCQGCSAHIESELQRVPGVAEANADYEKGNAVVVAAPTTSESELRKAVEAAGYSVSSAEKKTASKGGIQ